MDVSYLSAGTEEGPPVSTKTEEGPPALSREQQALVELGHTRYSLGVCTTLVIAFVMTMVTVPLINTIGYFKPSDQISRQLFDPVGSGGSPHPASEIRRQGDVLGPLSSWLTALRSQHSVKGALKAFNPWQLRYYEETLTLESTAGQLLRPGVQWFLTAGLKTGNQQVVVGRDGWLFFRADLRYVTEPGFLEPAQLAKRSADALIQPDPVLAIMQFHRLLKEIGVALVVFPIPAKVSIRPWSFTPVAGQAGCDDFQNPSWPAFARRLEQEGIPLLDVCHEMYRQEREGGEQFLRNDTHWSPRGAELGANMLADYLRQKVGVTGEGSVRYARQRKEVSRHADLAALLNLPISEEDALYPPQRLTVQQVLTPSGSEWRTDPSSDIMLIGDSFTEMYDSNEAAGIRAVGLAPQLAYRLQRPVHRIAGHAWVTYGAREALGTNVQSVRERALGRRIVVWEFAMRELAQGNWKLLN